MPEPDDREYEVEGTGPPANNRAALGTANGQPVAIFNRDGQLYAIGAICPHAGGPLDKGTVAGTQVTCPFHGSVFDLRTGEVVHGPARVGVRAYKVRIVNGGLRVEPV